MNLKAGEPVWAVCGNDVTGYMYLATVGSYVIATSYINDLETAEETLAYHEEETEEGYGTDLVVLFQCNCYATKEEAERALEGE